MSKERRAAVLIVGADKRWNEDMAAWLDARGYQHVAADGVEQAIELFRDRRPVLVLLILPLSGGSSAALSQEMLRIEPNVVLVVAGTDGEVTSAADAFDLGAYEHLERATPEAFLATLGAALGVRKGDVHLRYLREKDAALVGFGELVSNSPAMQQVAATLRQICRRTSNGGAPSILLAGETGTGKGFFAKCIHYNSSRRNQAFVEINCAALPPSLIESELFGYEQGAFTDAKTARMGLFEAASGGTLFLDEIATLPLDLQAKLLTAIEEKQIRRLGARQSIRVDVQIIAATHETLDARAKAGLFRYDLFHRLNVVAVTIPPLRERGADTVHLSEAFIAAICKEYGMPARTLTQGARDWIRGYSWPGNVRELRNRIERIILLENDEEIRAEHFGPTTLPTTLPASLPPPGSVRVSIAPTGLRVALPAEGIRLEDLERAVIREALVKCEGNVSRAARYLSISRQTLIYRMKKHRLSLRPERDSYPRLVSIAPGPRTSVRPGRRALGR